MERLQTDSRAVSGWRVSRKLHVSPLQRLRGLFSSSLSANIKYEAVDLVDTTSSCSANIWTVTCQCIWPAFRLPRLIKSLSVWFWLLFYRFFQQLFSQPQIRISATLGLYKSCPHPCSLHHKVLHFLCFCTPTQGPCPLLQTGYYAALWCSYQAQSSSHTFTAQTSSYYSSFQPKRRREERGRVELTTHIFNNHKIPAVILRPTEAK